MIDLLTYTSLYPNSVQTRHGIFIENRIRKLLDSNKISTNVLAPVPWFPVQSRLFGDYGKYARVPKKEQRHGIEVWHPRYPVIPKIGMNLAPGLMATSTYRSARALLTNKPFRLIDAHYFYPDGVAASLLGKWLNIPVVISARGTDINLLPDYRLPRSMIIWAARQAAAIITVSQSLKERLMNLGISEQKITVLPNGVDRQLFQPGNRLSLREQHQFTRPTLLYVGNLIPLKGVDIILHALADLPEFDCIVIGDGSEKNRLEKLATSLQVSNRVHFINTLSQSELVDYYTMADILLLPSSREGYANVLLEALSCGTPVIATAVGGNPDIITSASAGLLIDERSPDSLKTAIKKLYSNMPAIHNVTNYAQRFSWFPTIEQQINLYQSTISKHGFQNVQG
ncbi:MAG TPA: glycosyltransferase family 4 protein [Crenotrichaceae bacterium]|nr:glycosyltransferase family 4 protein [Crenotrichaceae bacterium]